MPDQLSFLEILEKPSVEALFKPDDLYEIENAEFLRQLPEDTRFEKKSPKVDNKALASLLSAFGNGPAVEGGLVVVGVSDEGEIEGCKHLSEAKLADIESGGRAHCPDGRFTCRRISAVNKNGEDDFIVLLRVQFVESRLVELTDHTAYCREGDKTRRLSEAEKQEFRINKGERAFELEPCPLQYPDDFREVELRRFAKTVREARGGSSAISDLEILQSMRMGKIVDGTLVPNNVCCLLFAKDPQIVFPGSYIHFLRYNGTEEKSGSEYNVIKDRMLSGTILEIIREASAAVDSNIREFTEFKNGKFYPVSEYPHDALVRTNRKRRGPSILS